MEEQPTCGKGLAAQAAVPRKLAELTDSVGEILELHTEVLDLTDERSKAEYAVYTEQAKRHRAIAAQLLALADLLASQRDLPMGRHDEGALTAPRHVAAFANLVRHEQELADLLHHRLADHRSMSSRMNDDP